MKLWAVLLPLAPLLWLSSPAMACTGIMGTPATWVRDAGVIVRVRAGDELRTQRPRPLTQVGPMLVNSSLPTDVQFEVLEVLKGISPFSPQMYEGRLSQRDDPNDRTVPYNFVRPEGRSGICFAYTYKRGAEYLLLLQSHDGVLTPYWATLGATNEQLFGDDDKWLAWVRERIRQAQN